MATHIFNIKDGGVSSLVNIEKSVDLKQLKGYME